MGAVGLSFLKKIKELLGIKEKRKKKERERAGPKPNCLELGFELELVSEPSRAEPSPAHKLWIQVWLSSNK